MNEITYEDTLKISNRIYIDVRSPGEFRNDYVPGATNIPIFDNNERSEIGKMYRLLGKDSAIISGTAIVGKKLDWITSEIMKQKSRDLIVMCARGGMRSTSVVALVNSIGIAARKLKDGYKGYRNYICQNLQPVNFKPKLFILHGLTGTGKTEIIRHIKNSIDLEEMAGHRSSLFGGIGMEQNSQKRFESLLVKRLKELENEKYAIIEGESRKLGNLHIPGGLFNLMKSAHPICINATVNRRLNIIKDEYTGNLQTDEIIKIINSLKTKLGSGNVQHFINLIKEKNYEEFIKLILAKYYDPLYMHKLKHIVSIADIENTSTVSSAEKIEHCIYDFIK